MYCNKKMAPIWSEFAGVSIDTAEKAQDLVSKFTQQEREEILKALNDVNNWGQSVASVSSSKEHANVSLMQYITTKSKSIVDRLKKDGTVEIEWGIVESNVTAKQMKNINPIRIFDVRNLEVATPKQITIDGTQEELLLQSFTANEREYIAIQVPKWLQQKKLCELETWKRLLIHKNDNWFINIDFTKTVKEAIGDWIVWEKSNRKDSTGKPHVDIRAYDKSQDTDVLRECLMTWTQPISLAQTLIVGEIIKYWLGEEYIDFLPHKADSDELWYQKIRTKIKTINDYLWMNFGEYVKTEKKEVIVHNRWIYVDKEGSPKAFMRGYSDLYGDKGAGISSLCLNCKVRAPYADLGFRSWL